MALVSYSESEGSDSESDARKPAPKEPQATLDTTSKTSRPSAGFQTLTDRKNPGKIRIALPEIKQEQEIDKEDDGDDDGPARKRPRTSTSGIFAGFNTLLPAPKRSTPNASKNGKPAATAVPRRIFSLKTGATPGFDREADAEMRRDRDQARKESLTTTSNDSMPKIGGAPRNDAPLQLPKEEEFQKKGNAMIFKPLSVARNLPKKSSISSRKVGSGVTTQQPKMSGVSRDEPPSSSDAPTASKPKISLFSFSGEEEKAPASHQIPPEVSATSYKSAVYATGSEESQDVSQIDIPPMPDQQQQKADERGQEPQTLDNIANDLNLSRSERRQLFGRNSTQQALSSKSRILTFNTDAEYVANNELLSRVSEEETAAAQHNPVRAIAPGKHTLRQLVNAATSQREALEESFASGRRNKKEAGSKYGW
ncbi:Mitotic checkpoint regulator, MAD2B-interacting domain containing protein [Elaphomyces granulatus]|jgi:hypothetical protein